MSRFRKLSHAIWHCKYHIVWVPKYRYRVLQGVVRQEVYNCLQVFLGQNGCEEIELKDASFFTIIGTSKGMIDNPQYVDGSAVFASDIVLEGMLYAVIARSPVLGGQVTSFDASAAEAIEGVHQVLEVKNGVAVLATSTWAALQGREALEVTWGEGASDLSTEKPKGTACAGVPRRLQRAPVSG